MKHAFYITVKNIEEKKRLSAAVTEQYGSNALNDVYIDIEKNCDDSYWDRDNLRNLKKAVRAGRIDIVHIRSVEDLHLPLQDAAECLLHLMKTGADLLIGGKLQPKELASAAEEEIVYELDPRHDMFLDELLSPLLAHTPCYVYDVCGTVMVCMSSDRETAFRKSPYLRDACGPLIDVHTEPLCETLNRYCDNGFAFYRPDMDKWYFMDQESIAELIFIHKKYKEK